jgi:hypothetical protein
MDIDELEQLAAASQAILSYVAHGSSATTPALLAVVLATRLVMREFRGPGGDPTVIEAASDAELDALLRAATYGAGHILGRVRSERESREELLTRLDAVRERLFARWRATSPVQHLHLRRAADVSRRRRLG